MKITFSFLKAAVVAFFIAFFSLTAQGVAHASAGDVMVPYEPPPPEAHEENLMEASLNLIQSFVDKLAGKDLVNLFVDAGLQISDKFHEWALALAGALALATMFWSVLMAWVQRNPIIDPVLEVLLYAAIAAFGINYYKTLITDIISMADGVIEYSGAGSIGGATQSFLQGVFHPIFNSIAGFGKAFSNMNALEIVAAALSFAFALIALLFVLAAVKDILRVLLMGPLYLAVGVALGPLFIATLASGFTRRWFDQWLNFVISASMLTAITALVLMIIGSVMIHIGVDSTGAQGQNPALMMGYALFCWSLSGVLSSIPQMVDAIFPGRTGLPAFQRKGGWNDEGKGKGKGKGENMAKEMNKPPSPIGTVAGAASKVLKIMP